VWVTVSVPVHRALLNFLFPEIFESSEAFDAAFNLTHQTVDDQVLRNAHAMLKPVGACMLACCLMPP
jgi:hypothetical protein